MLGVVEKFLLAVSLLSVMFTSAFHSVKCPKSRVVTRKNGEKILPVAMILEPAVGDCFLCGTGISRYTCLRQARALRG